MVKQDAAMPGTERPLGQDEVALHQSARFGVDDARHLHPVDERDDHGDDPEARP
ncbi:hypothetical protein D3C80_2231150 [compost metagenome]